MQKWSKFPDAPCRIALLLFDRFSNLCLANCLEPLRAANTLTGKEGFTWEILTPDGAPSRSSSGIEVLPHAALGAMPKVDFLLVLASYDHDRHDTPAIRRLLRDAARKADVVVGLDAGPWLLASAGLLQGRRYMLSLTWNAPVEAFDEPGNFFEGQGVDGVYFPFHKSQAFVGLDAMPTYIANDVIKAPDIDGHIDAYRAHLREHFSIS